MVEEVQFSSLKILGQFNRIVSYTQGQNIAPVTVEFHLTNGCNHDCWFCSDAVRRDVGKGAKLTWEVIDRTLREFADMGVVSVVFEGGGEPTSHPKFIEAFSLAHELGMKCGLTTHGGLIKTPEKQEVVARCASWIRMSIDSASNEVHSLMHRFKDQEFDLVMKNAQALRVLNPELVLGWSFIVCDQNYRSIYRAAKLADEFGFSYIDYKPLLVNRREYYMPETANVQLDEAAISFDGKEGHPIRKHPFTIYAARIEGGKPRVPKFSVCQSHRFIGNVAATGDVFICCAHAMLEGDDRPIERDRVVLGNLDENTFQEIWNSTKRSAVSEDFMNPNTVANCPSCRFGHHNEVLEAVTKKNFSPFI